MRWASSKLQARARILEVGLNAAQARNLPSLDSTRRFRLHRHHHGQWLIQRSRGGGEGKSGQGNPHPVSPWGQKSKGLTTRKNKRTDKFVVTKRRQGARSQ